MKFCRISQFSADKLRYFLKYLPGESFYEYMNVKKWFPDISTKLPYYLVQYVLYCSTDTDTVLLVLILLLLLLQT